MNNNLFLQQTHTPTIGSRQHLLNKIAVRDELIAEYEIQIARIEKRLFEIQHNCVEHIEITI